MGSKDYFYWFSAPREKENDEKAVVTSTASVTETFCPLFPPISSSVSPHIGVKVLPTLPNQITASGEEKDEKAKKEKESLSLKEKVAKIQMEEHFEQLKEIYGYIQPDSNKLSVYSLFPNGGKE